LGVKGEAMLSFKVEIDDKEFVLAGFEDWSILSLHVNARRGNPDSTFESSHTDEARFSVGGLSKPDASGVSYHVRWRDQELSVGSRIVVRVVETEDPDAPLKRYRSDSKVQENPFTEEEMREMQRKSYLELKKEFGSEQAQPNAIEETILKH
jgi:hypothetical protein